MRSDARVRSLALCLALVAAGQLRARVYAQDAALSDAGPPVPGQDAAMPDAGPPVPAQDAAPDVVPPALLHAPTPSFPEEARAAGLTEAVVLVRVTVDEQGQVTAAELAAPTGQSFDEVARQAALEYRFEPARRDGEPIAARILLRIEFRLPPPPPVVPPSAATPPPRAVPPPTASNAIDITVPGYTDAERMRRSAEAVHVVEIDDAKVRTADMGEVLAREQGVGVQRAGGLGSETRFSLNGLTDDQIRFFLDGVPLEFAGYSFGIENISINLVERVEIYRGVVPIRFGADALGGAVNVVTDNNIRGSHASASYQAGSFGTHLLSLSARHLDEPSGWFTRVNGFFDRADNDYPMDIEVPDARGREHPARVYRFHDAYAAEGASLETGVVDVPWADRLLLRGFVTHYDKEIQHNLMMTFNPYGDVELSGLSAGGTARYEHTLGHGVSVNAVAGYVRDSWWFSDVGECVYDWFGQCLRERAQPGERTGRAADQWYGEHSAYGRANLEWRLQPQHAVRLSLSPTYTERTGDERRQANPDARDPLTAEQNLFGFVSGVEYKLDLFDSQLENVFFLKDYLQVLRSEEPLSNGGSFQRRDRETHRFGIGDSLRYTFAEWIYAKLSYEWATRLPRADEIFGNGVLVQPNLGLEPELSHNINLGVTVDAPLARAGKLRADVNGFVRIVDQLILPIGDDESKMYQNVYSASSIGVDASAGWTSPGDYVVLDGNFTYVDFRNTSSEGEFAREDGERIPNRPYLFGNGTVRLKAHRVAAQRDELSLVWTSRYVHEFLRGWEGIGIEKLTIDAQLLHSLALIYRVEGDPAALSFSVEIQNITDAAAFDFYGVPRPGRAVYFKVTASL